MTEFLHRPRFDEAVEFAEQFFVNTPERYLLLIIGTCQISYKGRASSFLDWGVRLIICKQDGNIIVHQPTGREPVNWQPVGTKAKFYVEDELFILRAVQYKNREQMTISFRKVEMLYATRLNDTATIQIIGMERDIVDKIQTSPEVIEPGLRITQREKPTSCGLIDLYGYDKNHTPVIIEVKRSLATISAVQQLRMYITDLKKGNELTAIRGILCAPRIPVMVRKLLEDYGLEYREFHWEHDLVYDNQKTFDDYSK